MKMMVSELRTILNNTYEYLATHHVDTFNVIVQYYVYLSVWVNQLI